MSSSPSQRISDDERRYLLALAHRAVAHGVSASRVLEEPLDVPSQALLEHRAAFVSVYVDGHLRGCTGELAPFRSLISSVIHNAHRAAFLDDRFPPIRADELSRLRVSISVLTPQIPIAFGDEEELLSMLEPGVDGLTISAGERRATFLPQVWESLPEPRDFLAHLKHKAGLPLGPIPGLEAKRYRTETFGEQDRP